MIDFHTNYQVSGVQLIWFIVSLLIVAADNHTALNDYGECTAKDYSMVLYHWDCKLMTSNFPEV